MMSDTLKKRTLGSLGWGSKVIKREGLRGTEASTPFSPAKQDKVDLSSVEQCFRTTQPCKSEVKC